MAKFKHFTLADGAVFADNITNVNKGLINLESVDLIVPDGRGGTYIYHRNESFWSPLHVTEPPYVFAGRSD